MQEPVKKEPEQARTERQVQYKGSEPIRVFQVTTRHIVSVLKLHQAASTSSEPAPGSYSVSVCFCVPLHIELRVNQAINRINQTYSLHPELVNYGTKRRNLV